MKISRNELQELIKEVINASHSVLLESPDTPIVGQQKTGDYTKDPDGYEGEMAQRSLYHMATQAQQLHDMVQHDENLEPWVQEKITVAAEALESVFKSLTYDKQHPEGR